MTTFYLSAVLLFSTLLIQLGSAFNGIMVSCDTDLTSLKYSITMLVCPPNCWRQNAKLCGKGTFSSGPICLAAMQDGIINDAGGFVTVYKSSMSLTPVGGLQNGVQSKSCPVSNSSYTFQMTCATNGRVRYVVNEVWCPPGCGGQMVRGTDIYHISSSVCSAAVHAGKVSKNKGGYVTFYKLRNLLANFTGTNKNGVTSIGAPRPSTNVFTFEYVDECKLSPGICMNNATCIDLKAGFTCICTIWFKGFLCRKDILQNGTFTLQSMNYPDHNIGLLKNQGYIVGNTTFKFFFLSPGLCDLPGSLSLLATKQNTYLIISSSGGLIDASAYQDTAQYRNFACFYPRRDKFADGFISFESTSFPNYYIRHQDGRLKLHLIENTTLYREDASYKLV